VSLARTSALHRVKGSVGDDRLNRASGAGVVRWKLSEDESDMHRTMTRTASIASDTRWQRLVEMWHTKRSASRLCRQREARPGHANRGSTRTMYVRSEPRALVEHATGKAVRASSGITNK
jgi:hypothetical protein